ncbi:MAG: zinc metalloprotease HtpX [Methanomassiliicoccales archaeon]|nr:MAG: zinc metalloprotease HtpX [Methanomassiliicoccales archaeon]
MSGVTANLRTFFMFLVLIGIFMAIGWLVGAYFIGNWVLGTLMFLILAGLINFISYFYSAKIVLWSYRAKIVSEAESPRLHRLVRQIATMNGLPMPKIAVIPSQNPNAFATGRNPKNAVVAATEGIMRLLDDNELQGVLAHEMAHVRNRDILVMSVAATVAGAISFAARMAFWGSLFSGGNRNNGNIIVLMIVAITAPIAAMLLQLAISRSREYKADAEGAMLIGKPLYLARALEKLEAGARQYPMQLGSPTSSSLFIVNPFKGGALVSIFSTHPPVQERIRRLKAMANKMGQY